MLPLRETRTRPNGPTSEGERRGSKRQWGDSVWDLGQRAEHRSPARVPDGSAPRNTEPNHAPAAATATMSANRRLMRGALLRTEITTREGGINRKHERLTSPTYS